MRSGTRKSLPRGAPLAIAAGGTPAAATAAQPGVSASVWTLHARSASAAPSVNVLTTTAQRRIDNRIAPYIAPTGRLVLTAPEGLSDPDGSGANCDLDNAKLGES